MFRSAKMLLVPLFAVGLAATACGSSTKSTAGATNTTGGAAMATHEMGDPSSFQLKAAEQHSDGKSVLIEDVVLTGTSGWVAIHEVTGGAMGKIIGESTLLQAGAQMGVTVPLMHPLTLPAMVIAVLHLEDNNNTTFDFPNGDAPAMVGGAMVDVPIDLLPK